MSWGTSEKFIFAVFFSFYLNIVDDMADFHVVPLSHPSTMHRKLLIIPDVAFIHLRCAYIYLYVTFL